MKDGENLYFSPNYNISKMKEILDLDDPNLLCEAFKERVYNYYLDPAKSQIAFAQGILCCTLIDFLAKIVITDDNQVQNYRKFYKSSFNKNSYKDPNQIYVGERIVSFLVEKINQFNYEDGYYFYEYVRNGLIHEGRIKCGCYLNNSSDIAVKNENGVLIYNPKVVLQNLENWLIKYFQSIKKREQAYDKLYAYIQNIIDEDLNAIKKRQ